MIFQGGEFYIGQGAANGEGILTDDVRQFVMGLELFSQLLVEIAGELGQLL